MGGREREGGQYLSLPEERFTIVSLLFRTHSKKGKGENGDSGSKGDDGAESEPESLDDGMDALEGMDKIDMNLNLTSLP